MNISPKSAGTRARILDAAVGVFASKGASGTKISDLANLAGLRENTIYNHFKSKDEILVTLPLKFTRIVQENEDQLRGIRDPVEKMRKFVWFYLWWIRKNFEFMKVFIFEIRSNPLYYHSESYEVVREVTGIPIDILEEGRGVFRSDINPLVFKSFLFGSIEHLLLTRCLQGGSFDIMDDFDDLARMILDSVMVRETEKILDRKMRIVSAAGRLLAEADDVSVAAIAREAGVASGTIYDYFRSKKELLDSVCRIRVEDLVRGLDSNDALDELRNLLCLLVMWAQENPVAAKMVFMSGEKELHGRIRKLIESGIEEGRFREDLSVDVASAGILGTLTHLCTQATLAGNYLICGMIHDFTGLVVSSIQGHNL